ncbi:hypothetical protein PORY_000816 [Pneumocystis oryctolagi]|uniref:Uncharacterized protein n=1 Tax=Pneumocystis oryctolagi TaxID=42067 RepID=A0ACB7CEA0_9ASCO|nr:hypothetical protein PORY_000816 [Pneumocystis oryctolagi]
MSFSRESRHLLRKTLYKEHVWLPMGARIVLGFGAAIALQKNLKRADLLGVLTELTAFPCVLRMLHKQMLSNATGRRLLREQPRINSKTLDFQALRALPLHTVGRSYVDWMDTHELSPDTRGTVRYIDHAEWAYIVQRYRESHDFYHTLTGLPATLEGEVALKCFEFCHLKLPVTFFSILAGATRLSAAAQQRLWTLYLPWALHNGQHAQTMLNVYWEEELATNIDVLRRRLGIRAAPSLQKDGVL